MMLAAEVEDFLKKIFSTPFGRPRRKTAVTFRSGQSGEESQKRFFDSPRGGITLFFVNAIFL